MMQDYQRGWDDAMAQACKKGKYDLASLRQKVNEWRERRTRQLGQDHHSPSSIIQGSLKGIHADSTVVLAFLRWLEESDG